MTLLRARRADGIELIDMVHYIIISVRCMNNTTSKYGYNFADKMLMPVSKRLLSQFPPPPPLLAHIVQG